MDEKERHSAAIVTLQARCRAFENRIGDVEEFLETFRADFVQHRGATIEHLDRFKELLDGLRRELVQLRTELELERGP